MTFNWLTTIKQGYKYSQVWPDKSQLYSLFPECKIILATKFATQVLPIITIANFLIQLNYFGASAIPQASIVSLFILSMPVQGYIWLGIRAKKTLPLSLNNWYFEISDKLSENGVHDYQLASKPTYYDMALILNKAFKKLDAAWCKDWL